MTQKPPVPEASQSPYPVAEPPHFASSARYESDAEADGDADGGGFSLSRLFEDFRVRDLSLDDLGIDTRTAIGIGAAIGVGALAGVAALLYTRNRRAAPAAAKRKPAAKAKAKSSKPRTARSSSAKPRAASARKANGAAQSG